MKKLLRMVKNVFGLFLITGFVLTALPGLAMQNLGDGFYLLDPSIDPTSSLVVLELTQNEMAQVVGTTSSEKLREISRKLYTKFRDDWDFIFIICATSQDSVMPAAYWSVLHNQVEGIGMPVQSVGAIDRGSPSRLKGWAFVQDIGGWAFVSGTALHELMHQYAVQLFTTYDFNNQPTYGHWGVSNAGGVLGC